MAFALGLNTSCGSSGGPMFGDVWNSWPCKGLYTVAPLTKKYISSTENRNHNDLKRYFHICTVGLWSPSSALQVGMVKNVKFDHDFATFFGDFDHFHDRGPCSFFRFSFRATLYFYLMNALVHVDID